MGKLICRFILWLLGWKTEWKRPKELRQYVIIVAPHTSNWDFPIAAAAKPLLGYPEAYFLAKHSLFKPPFGFFFRWLRGTPVDRTKRSNLVEQAAEKYKQYNPFGLAIAPEGTRSYTEKFKTGFYYIAQAANVPIMFGYLNYQTRRVGIFSEPFYPTGDIEADMPKILQFYEDKIPLNPEDSTVHHGKGIKGRFPFSPIALFFKLLLLFGLVWSLANIDLMIYGFRQAKGQVRVIWEAEPIQVYLDDPHYPDSLKTQIRLVQEIRQYAFDSLGLDPTDSYTKMYDQKGLPILWVVTACEPFSLTNKEWTFPVLGTVSYKGHFEHQRALAEEESLKKEGWDTRIGEVNGWSTLGILNDPILSNMLNRGTGDLAELIIHELTHGTLFVKNNLQMNENLAVFVGEEGAKKFLQYKYGEGSKEQTDYLGRDDEYQLYLQYILGFTKRLDSLYKGMDKNLPVVEKQKQKDALLAQFKPGLEKIPFSDRRYVRYFEKITPNNAFFMGYVRYHAKQDDFREMYERQFGKDIVKFMAYLKEEHPSIF